MRCNACNVDVGENYTRCPLCGGTLSGEEPVLKNTATAEYPLYTNPVPPKKKFLCQDTLPALLADSVLLSTAAGLVSLCKTPVLWRYYTPAICLAASFGAFFAGIREKGNMLHFGAALLGIILTEDIAAVINLFISKKSPAITLVSSITSLLFLILSRRKKENMENQLNALFNR